MKKLTLLALNFLVTANIATASQEPIKTFAEFARKFAPPASIQETIANAAQWPHFGCIIDNNFFRDPDWFENYKNPLQQKAKTIYAKGNDLRRVINAACMRSFIKKNNLNTLSVPKKYVHEVNGRWEVVAETITTDRQFYDLRFTTKEIEDLMVLQEGLCYSDFHTGNVVRDKFTGKITFIDTENRSFSCMGHVTKKECLWRLYTFIDRSTVSNKQDLQLVRDRAIALEQNPDKDQRKDFVKEFQHPNNSGIDFEVVEKDFYNNYRY